MCTISMVATQTVCQRALRSASGNVCWPTGAHETSKKVLRAFRFFCVQLSSWNLIANLWQKHTNNSRNIQNLLVFLQIHKFEMTKLFSFRNSLAQLVTKLFRKLNNLVILHMTKTKKTKCCWSKCIQTHQNTQVCVCVRVLSEVQSPTIVLQFTTCVATFWYFDVCTTHQIYITIIALRTPNTFTNLHNVIVYAKNLCAFDFTDVCVHQTQSHKMCVTHVVCQCASSTHANNLCVCVVRALHHMWLHVRRYLHGTMYHSWSCLHTNRNHILLRHDTNPSTAHTHTSGLVYYVNWQPASTDMCPPQHVITSKSMTTIHTAARLHTWTHTPAELARLHSWTHTHTHNTCCLILLSVIIYKSFMHSVRLLATMIGTSHYECHCSSLQSSTYHR